MLILSVIFYNWEKMPRFTAGCTKSLEKIKQVIVFVTEYFKSKVCVFNVK